MTTAGLYRIRPATMKDSPGIRRLRNAAVRESLAIWTSVEQDPVQAEAWLAPMVQRGTALVAHVTVGLRRSSASRSPVHGTPMRAMPAPSRTRSTCPRPLKVMVLVPGFWLP